VAEGRVRELPIGQSAQSLFKSGVVLCNNSRFFPPRFNIRQNQMHSGAVLFGRSYGFFFGADNAQRTSISSQILPFLLLSSGGAKPGSQKVGQTLA